MTTLVVCIDRGETIAALTDELPVVGERAVRSLVTDVGLEDPESSRVNCLLEGLRLADGLRESGEEPVVAVVSGVDDSVDADRDLARQLEGVLADRAIESAVVVTDSTTEERVVHVVESRVRVDGVSRVVVRQARDLESTYYLLKQFLADEDLRQTVLVPIGVALLAIPAFVLFAQSLRSAVAAVAAITGLFVLYKGLGVDDALGALTGMRDGLYTGRLSVVTGVIAAGLALVGLVAGAISATPLAGEASALVTVMAFLFHSVPWLTTAALTASAGRVADEKVHSGRVGNAALNLPFVLVAVGLVIRGFGAYFLERAGIVDPLRLPATSLGIVSVRGFTIGGDARLAAFVVAGVLVSVLGVTIAMRLGTSATDERAESVD